MIRYETMENIPDEGCILPRSMFSLFKLPEEPQASVVHFESGKEVFLVTIGVPQGEHVLSKEELDIELDLVERYGSPVSHYELLDVHVDHIYGEILHLDGAGEGFWGPEF